jgi:multiple antibiotic resistance protein
MLEAAKSILLVVSALFPIVDPIGGSRFFSRSRGIYTPQTRRLVARHIAINSFILLVASFTFGSHVLTFFGLSIPVVQVGGGLVVISTGWAMLKQKDDNNRGAVQRTAGGADILDDSFYPLTLPLTVGPGSISVAITLGANAPHELRASLLAIVAAAVGSAIVAASIYICYGFSDRLALVIGSSE